MTKRKRKTDNWLSTFMEYVEETEAPRHFWLWGGISTIASALQRKVWLPFGRENIYPNMFVLLVAPPGECRKAGPLSLSRDLLKDIGISIFADSPTKRALTNSMSELGKKQYFNYEVNGTKQIFVHSSMTVVSKELASLLAVDPKAMIDCLTELWDAHDEWEYKTKGEGTDKLVGVCLNIFGGTTPDWIVDNLPEAAIGGGFTTRLVIVTGKEKYKWLSLPPEPDEELYRVLKIDLETISQLIGPFTWGEGAYEFYDKWYMTIKDKYSEVTDRRLRGNLSRLHTNALKAAMCFHVAEHNSLVLEVEDLRRATIMMEESMKTASEAFGGYGSSRTSANVDRIMRQIRMLQKTTFMHLLQMNFRDTNKLELTEVLETIEGMGIVKMNKVYDVMGNLKIKEIEWIGAARAEGATFGSHSNPGVKEYHRKKKEVKEKETKDK